MNSFSLRPAQASDQEGIQALIKQVHINPMSLDWRRFVVAVDDKGAFLGCAQLKPHRDGSIELASLAVVPAYQGQGIGSALIQHLLQAAPRPVYLTCRHTLGPYYERFGFRIVNFKERPPYFKRISALARVLSFLFPRMGSMLVMAKQ